MMKINKTIIDFAKVFIVIDLCLVLYSLSFHDKYWLLNAQAAFIASLFITITSFFSYKRNIQNRLSNIDYSKQEYSSEQRDKVDEIDDPFDLYSEYEEIPEEELTPEKIKEIIKDEKSKVKRNSLKNTVFSAGGFLSIYRVLGYGLLVFAFFALNNNNLFLPVAFLVGLGVVPIGVLFSKFIFKT
ncbi:hypothetical protein ACH5BF_06460 [Arcobacter sp. YIC-464]|uniref:hypothetical protein n=1 Tax=Arcobacter sp. YIC-464 TaxID=3376631 RepID=UPI003C271920